MTVFDLISKTLIGKTVYTKQNIPFKVESCIYYYEPLENKLSKVAKRDLNIQFNLNGIKLSGVDGFGIEQELIVTDIKLLELYYY